MLDVRAFADGSRPVERDDRHMLSSGVAAVLAFFAYWAEMRSEVRDFGGVLPMARAWCLVRVEFNKPIGSGPTRVDKDCLHRP